MYRMTLRALVVRQLPRQCDAIEMIYEMALWTLGSDIKTKLQAPVV